mgnify:CR=1 FL=1
MKKQYFKCALAVFTAIMTVLTVLILPAGAKSAVVNVQTWDFKQFDDVEVEEMARFERQTSSDGKIIIGLPDSGYNDPSLSIKDGTVKMNCINKNWASNWYHYWLIQFKLDNDLKAGKTYTFTTDLNITNTGEWPTNFSFFYTKYTQWEDYTNESGAAPNGEDTVVYEHISGGFGSKANYTYTITPETDLVAGGYLAIRFNTRSVQFDSSISKAGITETVPYAANEDLIIADDWDFTKLPKVNYANDTERSATASSDNRISLETTNKFWNKYSSLEIKNGKVTTTSISYYHDFCDFVLNLQLSEDLVSGKEYTFATDLTTTGKWVTPVLCYTAKVLNGETKAEDFGMSNEGYEGVELYRCEDPKGEACNNFTVKFTATDNMKAGGWLNVRFDVDNRVTTTTVSKAELLTVPTENEVTNSSVTVGEKFAFDGAEFKTGSGYKLIVNYNAAADAVLKVYEGETEKILGTLKAANTSASLDYVCGNTSPEFIIEGTGITVNSVSAGEYIKALAPDCKIDGVNDENRLYTKIVLPEINSELKAYYTVTESGETEIEGNVASNLDYDTEYTFIVKYKNSYRFYENANQAEQITVKTRKDGDVTGDETVNICDLVSLNEGLQTAPDNELYKLTDSDSLVYLRKLLLNAAG